VTLRSRLVLALVLLVTAGLGVFGVVTYRLYARSQYDRLDDQLRSSVPLVARLLEDRANGGSGPVPTEGTPSGPPVVLPAGTYAELRPEDGPVTSLTLGDTPATPELPEDLEPGTDARTVGSTEGSTSWRVVAGPGPGGGTVVVATPTTEVERSLDRLVLIEGIAGTVLVLVLGAGSWLILRRGLSPLERMAGTARTITAGDLTQRVTPADGRTEVGQLGLAINTMLGDLEGAFAERDATEQRLRQFLADASHELRTPLTSIQGFAELFRMGAERVDLPVIMRRIEEESERMGALVEDLLLLARLDETRPIDRQPVDLAVVVADACSDAVARDHERPITLDAPQPVVVFGDRHHLQQAVGNLVANALRHTGPGTPVEVSASGSGGDAVVVVRDHGGGLSPDAEAHAFDRFWRGDSARAGTGWGLGLSIVAAIAAEHGGTVSAANAPGGGAVFTVRLPVAGRPAGQYQ
jgi:two-component system OmpR family sensor kinase